jgi:hypothetical protein
MCDRGLRNKRPGGGKILTLLQSGLLTEHR